MALKRFYAEEKRMKSKSLSAGALGVLLFFAGQGLPVPAETLPEPDRESSIISGPDRENSTLSAPDQKTSTLPAPDRETSTIPGPEPVRSSAAAQPSQRTARTGRQQEAAPAAEPKTRQEAAAGTSGQQEAAAGGQAAPREAAAAQNKPSPAPSRWNLADQGLFLGAMAGMRFPSFDTDDTDWDNTDIEGDPTFSGGLFMGMDFGRVIVQAEVAFNEDKGTIENIPGFDKGNGKSLMIPLIVKGDFHLGPVVLQPLAGVYFNVTLGDLELEGSMGGKEPYAYPPIGMLFGGDVGIGFGRNLIFLDFRYAMDLGKTAVGNDPKTAWRRSAIMFNVGYQFFIWRKT
jgi:hypothetical protein